MSSQRAERRRILQPHLHVHELRIGDRQADAAHQIAVGLARTLDFVDHGARDAVGGQVVQLADVRDRVLAGGRLEAHRPVGGDQAVQAVAAPDLAVVAGLGGESRDSELEASGRVAVGGVHRDLGAGRSGARKLADARLFAPPVPQVRDLPPDQSAGNGEVNAGAAARAHHLDVVADLRVARP
ncbi:MAG TPA: hypothetical protein VNF69_02400 [Burkholderiales bacterium]|nr:hypothetical protein [Burkholderiales bacterium]